MMIERFKHGVILVDNYLPVGRGINLLHELVQAHYPGDVVFTTAAMGLPNHCRPGELSTTIFLALRLMAVMYPSGATAISP